MKKPFCLNKGRKDAIMTNVIGYNQLPDREEFVDLYINQGKLQRELAEIYGCGKLRIRQWIKKFGLETRIQGGGNNRKYDVTKEHLLYLINNKHTNDEIADLLGMSRSNVARCLSSFGLKRELNIPEYQKYARKVRYLTETNYAKYKEIINPDDYPRTLCGVDGGYQLDHIFGVRECFDKGLSIEECSSLTNLQMIPWKANLQKRKMKGKTDEY